MQAIPKNLETLSFRQLTDLETKILDVKTRKHDEAVARIQSTMGQKLAAMAAELGVKPETVPPISAQNGKDKASRKVAAKSKVAPKYRNPSKPDETWTGRGRQPRWMTATGKKPQEFLIQA